MNDSELYDKGYFCNRLGNDALRQASYKLERDYIESWLGRDIFSTGSMLDIGCSTGEFIDALGWNKQNVYGMEISEYARKLAESKGIKFTRHLLNTDGFFDLVVFRGTIQHLSNPFEYISRANKVLKLGGHVLFLATPNTNSLYYRWFKTLPFLNERLNYWIPCNTSLCGFLKKNAFKIVDVQYPYLRTPYANLVSDHLKCVRKLIFRTNDTFAFWRSSMTVLAQKTAGI